MAFEETAVSRMEDEENLSDYKAPLISLCIHLVILLFHTASFAFPFLSSYFPFLLFNTTLPSCSPE